MHAFFVTSTNFEINLTAISFGLIQALKNKGIRVGYCKPISQQTTESTPDHSTQLIDKTFNIKSPQPLSRKKIEHYLSQGLLDLALEDCAHIVQEATQGNDIIIVEGIIASPESSYASLINAALAKSINADIIIAAQPNGQNTTADEFIENIKIQLQTFGGVKNSRYIGAIINNYAQNEASFSKNHLEKLAPELFNTQFKIIATATTDLNTDTHTLASQISQTLDAEYLTQRSRLEHEDRITPPIFRYQLVKRAKEANKRIILPEGNEPRTIQAAIICQERKIARCVLLAKPDEVKSVADKLSLQIPHDLEIIDPETIRQKYIAPLVELRKAKGMTETLAAEALKDTVMLGTTMLATGDVDGLVSGAVHTTADTVRPALQLIKTAPEYNLVSSIFFMLLPEQVLVYGDCAINPNPTAEQLADIAIQSAESATAFGIVPRVAMISYSTGSSGAGADVEKVKQATDIAKQKRPDLMIDGPLQYDAATVDSIAKQKAPNSPVAGKATVFVFPDLNTGNTTYKAVQRSAQVISVGPMLQGLRKPVNDLSRGALVEDIVFTIALTAIQAINKK